MKPDVAPSSLMSEFRDLERDIKRALGTDRYRMRQRLRSIRQAQKNGKPFDRNLARLTDEVARSVELRAAKMQSLPSITFDESLPITAKRDEIAAAITEHQVIVVCGETGSGKSTQLPKLCLQLGRGVDGMIGHTQPRRIAARSVAARVAEELQSPVGGHVGFKIRFTDQTNPRTFIKLMTDGILLAETQGDRFLNAYDTIIIDEAHERSLNIDFLLGYIKRLLPRRPDLRLIITSATIDAERFSEHFRSTNDPAPVIEVSGRTYPVEVRYRPLEGEEDAGDMDLQNGVADAVEELTAEGEGDILIFMPTERDIRETAQSLRGRQVSGNRLGKNTEILPLYGRLSTAEQNRVFQSHGGRRIVIATNVAESSLTVPGIRSVIDAGTARISRYSARSKVLRLPIEPISRASADQRKGRCGRIGPGICIRLYSQEDFDSREEFTPPEIQRTNLAGVILQMIALKLGSIVEFPFLDPPRPTTVREGYQTLFELGAIDERDQLTDIGRKLGPLPVDPRVGRMILAAVEENCLREVLIIAAALEVQDPRERPVDKQKAADEAHEQFADEESDFLSYLKLWDYYEGLKSKLSRGQLRKACRQNFLSYNRMREWQEIHRQLLQLIARHKFSQQPRRDDNDAIHRALLTGLLSGLAFRGESHEYTGSGGQKLFLWPGSATFAKKPKWIVAASLVETSRRFARTVARINPNWIEPIAEHLVSRTYNEPHWLAETGSVMAYEKVTLFGMTIVPRRRIPYGRVDAAKARELFIQHALVEGDWGATLKCLTHNAQLLEQMEKRAAKSRRRDLLLGEEILFEFYDRRIPDHVYDGARLRKWLRKVAQKQPRALFLDEADLIGEESDEVREVDFPDALTIDRMRLPLEYHLEPGSQEDGVTLTVPQEALNQLQPNRLEWLVPGLLEEKITALIKSLPKPVRRNLTPANETAKRIAADLKFGEGSFATLVTQALGRIAGTDIRPEVVQQLELPNHLRMNVRVVDAEGETLDSGRNLTQIRKKLGAGAAVQFAEVDDPQWRRDGIVSWDLEELPKRVDVERGGLRLRGYPALLDREKSVSLRLLDCPHKATHETRAGARRLFLLATQKLVREQVEWLPNLNRMLLTASTLPDASRFRAQIAELIAERAFLGTGTIPRDAQQFDQQLAAGRERLGRAVQDVAALLQPLLEAYQRALLAVESATGPGWEYAITDIKAQLRELFAAGFLTTTPWNWLQHYPRYLQAICLRMRKLSEGGVSRDRQNFALIQPRSQAYLTRLGEHTQRGVHDPELLLYRWMLEEFRVSLFAQELGTSVSVSTQRLDKQGAKVKA